MCTPTMYLIHSSRTLTKTKKSRNPLKTQGLREVRPAGFEPVTFRVGAHAEKVCTP